MVIHGNITLADAREPIKIGTRLRAQLRKEHSRLMAEWKVSLRANRREIERQIAALDDLLEARNEH